MSTSHPNTVHFLAGGIGGAAGVFVACPLDVIKTRQQSSVFRGGNLPSMRIVQVSGVLSPSFSSSVETSVVARSGLLHCFRLTIQNEGFRALYKGLTPALVGVVPYRSVSRVIRLSPQEVYSKFQREVLSIHPEESIYFATYAKSKRELKKSGWISRDSSLIPPIAGWIAGAAAVTVTCPIWVLKTRLQLDSRKSPVSLAEGVKRLFQSEGLRGFYRGLFISYIGLSETMVQFYLYEQFKDSLTGSPFVQEREEVTGLHSLSIFALAACVSKIIATTICYPHEVIRTRLRQPSVGGRKMYDSIGQTLFKIGREEGVRGFYGGLSMQLLRMIPHTVTMLVVYEAVVSHCNDQT